MTTPAVAGTRRQWRLLFTALALVLIGGSLASWVQTDNGKVSVRDTRFAGNDGTLLSGLLYVPDGVTAKKPAPAVLAVHGYINSRETESSFAIELARRGFVVLSIDQQGHGFSDSPALGYGFGGPAALAYLHSLDIVDKNNIGMTGHSMGGWTILAAAGALPDYYKSMVLVGSSTGGTGSPAAVGTPTTPKNLALVYGTDEEFSQLMWGTKDPGDVQDAPTMKALFGTTETVKADQLYGSLADGTARIIYRPSMNHPGLTHDPAAVSRTVDWLSRTLDGEHKASGQIWWLKEIGTLIAFAGGLLFLFPFGALLLGTRFFAPVRRTVRAPRGIPAGGQWIVAALIAAAIPALTFFWFQLKAGEWWPASALLPQTITTGIMGWALGNALISLVLLGAWHLLRNRRTGAQAADYGLSWDDGLRWGRIGRSALLAVTTVAGLYGLLALSDWLFQTDFRIYVVQLHLMDVTHIRIFLTYLLPFTVFFVVVAAVLHGQMRPADGRWGLGRLMAANVAILVAGIVVLLIVDYLPLLTGGSLLVDTQPLLIIVAYPFVPMLAVAALLSTYFFDRTGSIYPGAFISALLITWNIVGGTATQFPLSASDAANQTVRVALPLLGGLALLAYALWRRRSVADVSDVSVAPADQPAAVPAS